MNYLQYKDSIYPGNGIGKETPFVLKLDSSGNFQWFKKSDSVNNVRSYDIVGIPGGGCVTAGLKVTNSTFKTWVTKYTESGSEVWTKYIGNNRHVKGGSLAYDEVANNIYVTGFTSKDTSAGASYDSRAYIHCLDSLGNTLWSYEVGSDADVPLAFENSINSVAIVNDKLYFTGVFKGNMELWPRYLSTNGNADVLIGKATLSNNFAVVDRGKFSDGVRCFPNPTNRLLYLENLPKHSSVKLYNLNGKLLIQEVFKGEKASLDLSQLSKGVYLLELQNTIGESDFRKVMKE